MENKDEDYGVYGNINQATGKPTFVGTKEECKDDLNAKKLNSSLKEIYESIIKQLKKYCDLREDYYPIISVWAIGTYFHKSFSTYPYLFFNAMKGSGKTRLLNLLANLCHNGKLLVSLSEAVLFRTASQSSFFIDEFENVGSKDKSALRELLNVGYKKGMYVERAKKVKCLSGEEYQIERYNLYCPISMANIWGMENVLADRCIILTIERSNNSTITRMIEDFQNDDAILGIKSKLVELGVDSFPKKIYNVYEWNEYLLNSTIIQTLLNTTNSTNLNLYDKIYKTNLNSRHLELFFPLFSIANFCGEGVLDKILEIAETIVNEKKDTDIDENNDIMLINFVSELEEKKKGLDEDYWKMKEITNEFKKYYSEEEEEQKWINSKWLGKALKRLVLVKKKRKVNGRIEIILDKKKAQEKSNLFKLTEKPKKVEEEKPKYNLSFSEELIKASGLPVELIEKAMKEVEMEKNEVVEKVMEKPNEEKEKAEFMKYMEFKQNG